MNCLTIANVPRLEEALKDRGGKNYVSGSGVARSELARALLLHGSYDRYYFTCDSVWSLAEARNTLSSYPNHARAQIVLVDDYRKLQKIERMVLLVGGASLGEMAHLRSFHGRPIWPVTGITHALSQSRGIPMALTSFFADMYAYDCLVCTSHAGRAAVEKIIEAIGERIESRTGVKLQWKVQLPVIPLGVDSSLYVSRNKRESRRRWEISEAQTVFLYLGRFDVTSKLDPFPLLLSFSRGLGKEKDDALLILAGDDTLYHLAPQLKRFANNLGLADKVLILPNITNEEKLLLYAVADVFVSPSDNVQETFGLTIIEAMAAGLPVIASDWDGYRESIIGGETGFLAATYMADCVDHVSRLTTLKDDPSTHWMLSQAVNVDMAEVGKYMRILYDSPDLRIRMGERGRRRVLDNYDWPRVVEKYEQLWASLMTQARESQVPDTAGPKHGVFSYDYMKVFSHYASQIVTESARLSITPLGREFANGELQIRPLMTDLPPFTSRLSQQIARACMRNSPCSINALIEDVGKACEASHEIIFHHVMRLTKYCILEISASE